MMMVQAGTYTWHPGLRESLEPDRLSAVNSPDCRLAATQVESDGRGLETATASAG